MNQNDIAIAAGGISAPLWLPALNEWLALVLGVMSIAYIGVKLWKLYKNED